MFGFKKIAMPTTAQALPGRGNPIRTAVTHFVNTRALKGPYPDGLQKAMFGIGCFWGAERKFWELGDGIHVTAVGYAGGLTPNQIYEEVCSGRTGHNEVVLVVALPRGMAILEHNADVLDAVVCVLAGVDFVTGQATGPGPDILEMAKKEGWIWVRRPSH